MKLRSGWPLALFVVLQASLREPLMRLGIFTAPNLAAANAAQFLLGAAWIPMFFFLNLYLQQVLGLGAFASGAALLPLTVTIMVGMVGVAPRLIARFGPKTMTVTGLATLAGGLVWLSFIRPDGSFTLDVLPASLVAAAGMAMASRINSCWKAVSVCDRRRKARTEFCQALIRRSMKSPQIGGRRRFTA